MPRPLSIVVGLLMLLGALAGILWFIWWTIKRSDDPAKMVFKWSLTLLILGLFGLAVFKEVGFSAGGAFIVPFICVAIGIVMSVTWAPHLGAWLAKPLTSMFDGGETELEPQPLYSSAIAKRKAGKYREALYAVQKELEKFPNDLTGQMMIAEIEAEDMKDLTAAKLAVDRICNQQVHPPNSIAYALNTLADWQLKYHQDPDAARETLERVQQMLPGTEYANLAAQRIAHLGGVEMQLAAHEPRTIHMNVGDQDVGLLGDTSHLKHKEIDPAALAASYVQQLTNHPLDNEVREKLALLYAEHYQRPDLAAMELEQLVQQPHQPAGKVVRWLNLLADIHVRFGQNEEGARAALNRIIERYPNLSHAQVAEQRLGRIRLEIKGQQKNESVKLGAYEQDLGLKKRG
jgi:outer membrane protein assembly factor BamD (BamD/ComL family)